MKPTGEEEEDAERTSSCLLDYWTDLSLEGNAKAYSKAVPGSIHTRTLPSAQQAIIIIHMKKKL
jgi:hypothetical protein